MKLVSDRFNHQNRKQWQRLYSKSYNGLSPQAVSAQLLRG
nr:MAG TPA: hypothetical protein [Caudoviricetes sp.]